VEQHVAKAVKGKQTKQTRQQGDKRPAGKATVAKKTGAKTTAGKKADAKAARSRPQKSRVARQGERKGAGKFLRDVRVEMSKVTWPTRKDLIQSTIVVFVAVTIATLLTTAYDLTFNKIVTEVIKLIK
jgi:preprotein translocase subunit SecE